MKLCLLNESECFQLTLKKWSCSSTVVLKGFIGMLIFLALTINIIFEIIRLNPILSM